MVMIKRIYVFINNNALIVLFIYLLVFAFKQQKYILSKSEVWSLEVWNQDIGRAMPPLRVLEKNSSAPSSSGVC